MRTIHQVGHALRSGLGLALVAAFALVNGHASADPVAEEGAVEDGLIGHGPSALASGIYQCSIRGTGSGSISVNPSGICTRFDATLPGASALYCRADVCASCRNVSRRLGCLLISPEGVALDLPAGTQIYSCTLAGGRIAGSLVVKPDRTCKRYGTALWGASDEHCSEGVCPSCASLGNDIGCVTSE